MKKILTLGVVLIIIGISVSLFLHYKDDIYNFIEDTINGQKKEVVMENFNKYYRDYDFTFVQNTKNFSPKNHQDLLNIYYTIINSGNDEFTFYCPKEYKDCIKDVQSFSNDQTLLSDINNYVHPFNSFKHVSTEYDTGGRVTFSVEKAYTEEEINQINNKIDSLEKQLINKNDSDYNNILRVHDYIINNSRYDSDRADNNIINYKSDIAYGPLFEGYAICGGYTDLMQLFLERMNIKSFKVSSDMHVWNAVYYNNSWLNLDLTWDDPIVDDGSIDYLEHKFFLISTNKLHQIETTEHDFDYERYLELKEA